MLNALAEGGERERMFIVILYGGGKHSGNWRQNRGFITLIFTFFSYIFYTEAIVLWVIGVGNGNPVHGKSHGQRSLVVHRVTKSWTQLRDWACIHIVFLLFSLNSLNFTSLHVFILFYFLIYIKLHAFLNIHNIMNVLWRGKWQPTPVFLPGESCGQRNLVGCCLWGCTELDTTEVT